MYEARNTATPWHPSAGLHARVAKNFIGASLENRAPGVPPGNRVPGIHSGRRARDQLTPGNLCYPQSTPTGAGERIRGSCTIRHLQGSRISQPLKRARGRSRTDTLLRAADFPATSAFAAPGTVGTRVRGLEHAFTIAIVGLRCPPSALYTFLRACEGLARHQLGHGTPRAFTEFDGLHLADFSARAQVVRLSPLRLPIPPLGH